MSRAINLRAISKYLKIEKIRAIQRLCRVCLMIKKKKKNGIKKSTSRFFSMSMRYIHLAPRSYHFNLVNVCVCVLFHLATTIDNSIHRHPGGLCVCACLCAILARFA